MKIWLDALKKVLDERNIIFLNDDDLVMLVNREIKKNGDPRCTITKRTYQNWKAGKFTPDEETASEFLEAIQLAYIEQKELMGDKLQNEPNFVRWAWILERRFPKDFALVNRHETTNRNEMVIQITAGNEENKKLIESIINGTAIDIPFNEVQALKIEAKTDNTKEDEYDF